MMPKALVCDWFECQNLINTSLLLVSHPCWRMIAGFSVSQSPL